MHKTCAQCQSSFEITDADLVFYEKMNVPPPTLCPECRQQRRLAFRNFRHLYNRKCSLSGKQIISMYQADTVFSVYDQEVWWSDQWNGSSYGMDFNFQKSFFEQYQTLLQQVPRFAIQNVLSENSKYSNIVRSSKNCYLTFGCIGSQDCYYGHIVWQSDHCIDSLYVLECEFAYECTDCIRCYQVRYSQDCADCHDSAFLFDCTNCSNCFGCVGLRNKEYHIFNQPYSKDEYVKKMAQFDFTQQDQISTVKKMLGALVQKHPHRYMHSTNIENCTGDYLYNCQNVQDSFDIKNSQDIKFAFTMQNSKDCYDMTFNGVSAEQSYECLSVEGYKLRFCHLCLNQSSSLTYCDSCFGCQDCFGCVGLKKQKYCILNKQYSKDEYEKLTKKIIEHMKATGEWGEFFSVKLSPFAYNETMAQEYFPLSIDQAATFGMNWKEEDLSSRYQGTAVFVPGNIEEVPDSITKEILTCENCSKNYKIIPQELRFYRDMKLPIPRTCFECRHNTRMALRNPRKLWDRTCMKCTAPIKTSYAPDRKELVYCEKCYQETVY